MVELIILTVGIYSFAFYGKKRAVFRKGVRIETVAIRICSEKI